MPQLVTLLQKRRVQEVFMRRPYFIFLNGILQNSW